jgi:hypothetical protein
MLKLSNGKNCAFVGVIRDVISHNSRNEQYKRNLLVINNTVHAVTTPELLYVINWSFISCQAYLRLKSGEPKCKATELQEHACRGKTFRAFHVPLSADFSVLILILIRLMSIQLDAQMYSFIAGVV